MQAGLEWGHCFQGNCVNRIVRRTCPIPLRYPENGNTIECLVGGAEDPVVAFNALRNSPSHMNSLFGLTDLFLAQTYVGIGFREVTGSSHRFYYSILISELEG